MIGRSKHASGLARCLVASVSRFPGFLGEGCSSASPSSAAGLMGMAPQGTPPYSRTAAAVAPAGPSGMQIRSMTILFPDSFVTLNSIADNKGAVKKGKRVGRGPGSGLGKTCGRGHKGQKARTGRGPRLGFEGGQTPMRLSLPKRGFINRTKIEYWPVNLDRIQERIEEGRIDPSKYITMKDLQEAGVINKKVPVHGVKLLGRGAADFKHKVDIQISQVSPGAREAVERNGGTVTTVYYNKLGLRALLKPDWFSKKGRLLPRPVQRPPPRLVDRFQAVGALPPREDQCLPQGHGAAAEPSSSA